MEQLVFKESDGKAIPYCQSVFGKGLPGKSSLLVLLHGAGERGVDNAAQLCHGFANIADYAEANKLKLVVLAPQCPVNQQWVNTPWGQTSHTMPEAPSESMEPGQCGSSTPRSPSSTWTSLKST